LIIQTNKYNITLERKEILKKGSGSKMTEEK